MNKTSKLFMGFASLAMLAACSDDAPVMDGGNNSGAVFGDGQTAYMSVVLTSPRDFSRSTDFGEITDDNKNQYLVPGHEHDITSAKFFFFDEEGNFVLNAKLMSPNFDESTDKPNIEWESTSNVLVLEDLKSNTFPRYMLTVLNFEDFEPEATLQATAEKLVEAEKALKMGKKEDGETVAYNFVMSTSSYKRTSAFGTSLTDNSTYAVNELKTSDFYTTPTEATTTKNAVEVHVERLAAKVELDVLASDKLTYTDDAQNVHTIYKLQQTVAGDDNDNNDGNLGNTQFANSDLYLEVLGWSLNATAKESHMSKQLKNAWFTTDPYKYWEDVRYFRSYWAYSYPYTLNVDEIEGALKYVNYTSINANGLSPKIGSDYPQYCLENTNDPKNILDLKAVNPTTDRYSVYNSRVTHVVLNTRLCDDKGNDISALNFRGTLFTEEALKNYALNALKNGGKLNYYTYTGGDTAADKTETKNYKQVEVSAIAFEGIEGTIGNAKFVYATPDVQLYQYVAATEDVAAHYEEVDYANLETALNALANGLDIEWYNARNIYYIPVEHDAPKTLDANKNNIEGYYGVVRNHWYKISIDSFSKVGHGVYDPDDDTIVIKPGDPDDTLYYLGARINVLSWRVINQKVEL